MGSHPRWKARKEEDKRKEAIRLMQRYLNTYSPYLRTSIETKHKFVAIENRLKSIGLIPYQADHEEIVPLLRQQLPYIELSSTVKEAKKLIKFSLEQVSYSLIIGQVLV